MSDDEVVDYTRKVIHEKKIRTTMHLKEKDNGLYLILLRRKLLNQVKLEKIRRNWAKMSDDELIDYTKKFIEDRGIKSKSKLNEADHGLYSILRQKKLLDRVFSDVEKNELRAGIGEIIQALAGFRTGAI